MQQQLQPTPKSVYEPSISRSIKVDPVTGRLKNEHGHEVVMDDGTPTNVNYLPDVGDGHGFEFTKAEDPSDSFNFENDHLKVKE